MWSNSGKHTSAPPTKDDKDEKKTQKVNRRNHKDASGLFTVSFLIFPRIKCCILNESMIKLLCIQVKIISSFDHITTIMWFSRKKIKEVRGVKDDLLDRLARENGTVMLSDLHGYISRERICDAVEKIPPEDYTLEEWEEAAGYILGKKPPHFRTAQAARRYLCNCLRRF